MGDSLRRMCVLLPLATDLRWIVPQNCLAELVTVHAASTEVPGTLDWRGHSVPVIDFGAGNTAPWLDEKNRTGLVAVFLGLREQPLDYWGAVLRGAGLGVRRLDLTACRELEPAGEYALASFELEGQVYSLPDLPALQLFACEKAGKATA